jgi:hypothetical protein
MRRWVDERIQLAKIFLFVADEQIGEGLVEGIEIRLIFTPETMWDNPDSKDSVERNVQVPGESRLLHLCSKISL